MIKTGTLQQSATGNPKDAIPTYTFVKEDKRWYIHLPGYQEQGWRREDLEMVDGARKLLNIVAGGVREVTLRMSTEPFEDADVLELVDHCEAPRGGAIYLMKTGNHQPINTLIWVCDIALYVFGDMPDHIYVQRI